MSLNPIPVSHRELIDGPYVVALSTVMPDGRPQTTPVWCNRYGDCLFINVMQGFRKEKNMRLNPNVTLLAFDPRHPLHDLEIRGRVVEMIECGASEHADKLTQRCTAKQRFYGDIYGHPKPQERGQHPGALHRYRSGVPQLRCRAVPDG